MDKIEKTYPSGILNPEYVEELFKQLLPSDQEKLLEKLNDKIFTSDEEHLVDVLYSYSPSEIEDALETSNMLDDVLLCIPTDDLIDHIQEEDLSDYFSIDNILIHYSDEEVAKYVKDNGIIIDND